MINQNFDTINIDNVVTYLLEHKLINNNSIVDGDLQIFDVSRKNKNIKVIRKNDTSFLLKQSNPTDTQSSTTIKREALLYALMQNDEDFLPLLNISPRLIDFDVEKNLMITEFVIGSSFRDHVLYAMNETDTKYVGLLGKTIANYHYSFAKKATNQKLKFLPRTFIFENLLIHPGPEIFISLSQANMKLLKIIQKDQKIYDLLEGIVSSWDLQTLIHGDIKFDNIIIASSKKNTKSVNKILITDWEMATIGDPAWDIGSIFQEFVRLWLSLLPITGADSAEQLINISKESFQNMQKFLRAFWNGYYEGIDDKSAKELNELLIKSTNFCSLRLIQSAYEMLTSQSELNNLAVYMIQISSNILASTDNAITHLLGIPLRLEL